MIFFLSNIRHDRVLEAWRALFIYEHVDTWNKILQKEKCSKTYLEQNLYQMEINIIRGLSCFDEYSEL